LCNRTLAIVRDDRLESIKRPAHLLLQCKVVFNNEQCSLSCHESSYLFFYEVAASACLRSRRTQGSDTDILVPSPSVLCTLIRPPSSWTYCCVSYMPIPIPLALLL